MRMARNSIRKDSSNLMIGRGISGSARLILVSESVAAGLERSHRQHESGDRQRLDDVRGTVRYCERSVTLHHRTQQDHRLESAPMLGKGQNIEERALICADLLAADAIDVEHTAGALAQYPHKS